MVSHKYKCIYVHIPKTGGTSIENVLQDKTTPKNSGSTHLKIIDYKNKFSNEYEHYFKFSFVRNPWDRIVSGFHYFESGGNGSIYDSNKKKLFGDNFKKFVKNLDAYCKLKDPHFLEPQYEYIYIDGKSELNKLFRFEQIKNEFTILRETLNLEVNNLYKTRISKHKHYTEYYDDETRQIVAEKYAKDIEYFGYEFAE